MTHLTGNIFSYGLPEGAVNPWVMERYEDTKLGYYITGKTFGDEDFMWSESIKLADYPNAYRLIGVWPGLSEQQAGEVVTRDAHYSRQASYNPEFGHYQSSGSSTLYKDYVSGRCVLHSRIESLNSLMEAKGITTSVAVIEKLKS